MATDSYANLKAAISTRMGDAALDSQIDDFIDFAEAWFNRTLRSSHMEELVTLTTDSEGQATLPTGFLSLRSVRYNGSPLRELVPVSMGGRNRLSPFDTADFPVWYTITGVANVHKIRVTPLAADVELIVNYFEKIPALDSTTTTNWLLDLAPDAYFYRCLAEAYTARQAFDKASGFANYAENICDQLISLDERARYGNAEIVPDWISP